MATVDTRPFDRDLFVALKAKRDGHEFINSAFENGVVAALGSYSESLTHLFPLFVPDVMVPRAMARFAGTGLGVSDCCYSVGKIRQRYVEHEY